jgi:chemotaxis response regulator CheB
MPISVLLADDNDIIRRAPSHPLSLRSDMKVVGEDADFTETLLMIEGLNPMSLS